MKRAVVALLISMFAASAALAHPPPVLSAEQEKAGAEEITAFRKDFAAAVTAKNAAKLRGMYAETFTHTHSTGKQDGRDARIVAVLAGDPVIEMAPVEDLVVRMPGGWTAIVTAKSPLKSLADGKTYVFAWIAVYVRTEQSWQLAASQATRLNEIKP